MLRVARLDLGAARPAVIGEEIAAAELDRAIDQPPEMVGGLGNAIRVVIDVQVHDGADPGLARPGQKAFVVLLDQADGSVDQRHAVPAEIRAHGGEERGSAGRGT